MKFAARAVCFFLLAATSRGEATVGLTAIADQLAVFAAEWRTAAIARTPSTDTLQAARAAAAQDSGLAKSSLARSYIVKYFDDLLETSARRAKLHKDVLSLASTPKAALSPLTTSAWREEEGKRLHAQWTTRLAASAKMTTSIVDALRRTASTPQGANVGTDENSPFAIAFLACFKSLQAPPALKAEIASTVKIKFRVLLVLPEGLYAQFYREGLSRSSYSASIGMGGGGGSSRIWELSDKTGLVAGYGKAAAEDDVIETMATEDGTLQLPSLQNRTLRVYRSTE